MPESSLDFSLLADGRTESLLDLLRGVACIAGRYDPELLYVECQVCGKPVLWEPGKTTALLVTAGVDVSRLDERCMILSDGCPLCTPEEAHGFTLAVVRLAGLTPDEAVYMTGPYGNA